MRALQSALQDDGHSASVTGTFGATTAKAVRSYAGLKSRFDAFKTALSSASPMVLPKLSAGSYIVRSFPGNAKNLGSSMSMAVDFARSQRIEVPKDATSAI